MKNNKIYIVGAGIGDIELLTLKGKRLIETADVIVYDRLLNPLILYLAKKDCKLIYAGKQPHNHHLSQDQIHTTMLAQYRQGHHIVRLKGGDPAIYGRVGEEMDILDEANIPYEIVPGITAASAASIYAGIPLTYRNISESVMISTPQQKLSTFALDDHEELLNGGTLVLYMGIENFLKSTLNAGNVVSDSLSEIPVAIVEWGAYGRQRTIIGTVSSIADQIRSANVTNPALIIIGESVRTRAQVSWFEKLPLFGKRILLVTSVDFEFDKVVDYTSHGADVWLMKVGDAVDQRFDEITKRVLAETCYTEVKYLESGLEDALLAEFARLDVRIDGFAIDKRC